MPSPSPPAFATSAAVTSRYRRSSGGLCARRGQASSPRPSRTAPSAHFVWSGGDTSSSADEPGEDDEKEMSGPRSRVGLGAGAGAEEENRIFLAVRSLSTGPDDREGLREQVSSAAVDAFQQTVVGVVGALPSDAFEITVTSDRNGMATLMHSAMCNGYALRSAEFRLVLNDMLSEACGEVGNEGDSMRKENGSAKRGRPKKAAVEEEPDYMQKVPQRGLPRNVDMSEVSGVVHWWDAEKEQKGEMDAKDHIARLENEIELLKDRLSASSSHGDRSSNRILKFMDTLSETKCDALQDEISPAVEDCFQKVLTSLLGDLNNKEVQSTFSMARDYCATLTQWCLLIGYVARNFEKKDELAVCYAESLD